MRIFHAAAAMSVFCAFAGLAATTTAKSTAHKSTPSKSTAKKAVPSTAKTTGKRAKGKAVKAPPAATWRTRQQTPTPDRYKEIQQALVDKGYLKGEPTGVWDADSSGAMQRFQQDQKLTPSGKINSPSLIGLGLGAKSAGAPEAPPIKQDAPSIKQEASPTPQSPPLANNP